MIPGARPAWDAVRAAILAENARLEQQVVELRRELSESKAALLHVPFPLSIDEWARGPKLDKKEKK